jgi:hypothetical protein
MADEKTPPHDESEDGGQGGSCSPGLIDDWPTPADPVGRQQAQAYGDEILLEVEETHRPPIMIAFQRRLDIDLEGQVDDGASSAPLT